MRGYQFERFAPVIRQMHDHCLVLLVTAPTVDVHWLVSTTHKASFDVYGDFERFHAVADDETGFSGEVLPDVHDDIDDFFAHGALRETGAGSFFSANDYSVIEKALQRLPGTSPALYLKLADLLRALVDDITAPRTAATEAYNKVQYHVQFVMIDKQSARDTSKDVFCLQERFEAASRNQPELLTGTSAYLDQMERATEKLHTVRVTISRNSKEFLNVALLKVSVKPFNINAAISETSKHSLKDELAIERADSRRIGAQFDSARAPMPKFWEKLSAKDSVISSIVQDS